MDCFEESLEENVGFEADEDPNTFEEFLEPEEYIDLGHLFTTDQIFSSKDELVHWAKQTTMNAKTYLIITRYQRSRTADRRSYVTLACEGGGLVKKYKKAIVDDEEEEVPKKRRGPYETKKSGCPFKLKGEQMATSESWQLFVHNGRHNHKLAVYNHGHAQAARLMEEQLQKTKQFRKSHVPPRNILRFLREQDVGCTVSAHKIYNVVAKIKRNRMQGRNTVEEVLCLSAQRGYTVFHRNREESNYLVILSLHTQHRLQLLERGHMYNMPLLEAVGMTPIGKNFTVATVFMCNEQATTYRWILQQIKHLYFAYAMSNGQGLIINEGEPLVEKQADFLHYLFSTWLNPFTHKFCRVWTSQVLHFGVETTNRAESEYSVLKVWLSMCHGDLDTVFLNIDSLIQGQIAEIKYTLEISKLKEKYGAKSNAILKNLSNKFSHLALKKIMDELKKAREMVEEPGSNCLHYLRKSHGLPCACELVHRDKSHWEYFSVAHRNIGKPSGLSSGSRSGLDSGSGPSPRGRDRPPCSGRGRGRGLVNPDAPSTPFPFNNAFLGLIYEFILNWKSVVGDGNCGFRVVSNFLFGDENHWVEIRRRMCFDLHHRMNVYVQLFGSVKRVTELIRRTNWEEGSASADYCMDALDHLYVIANAFNLCVVFLAWLGSTTILPLVSNMDGNAGTIFIRFIEEPQHFIHVFIIVI
ncbi:hypothetical protein M9H77_18379 [Catharanthus roseus]|uniref:Uncharacterized protein n=1 Tax=Catharanthus roseus TaxID=4058 RepID=A0ACC0B7A4_CATRO|nr:hypothetical protein M9H77_18379 [Catharanthus roseus]